MERGDGTRNSAYSLHDFLDDCKNHKERIFIEKQVRDRLGQLAIFSERSKLKANEQIADFLAKHNEEEFHYVNTKVYRNSKIEPKPLVDAYKLYIAKRFDLYFAFYIAKTKKGWVIKSFHSDSGADTMAIGEMYKLKLEKKK